MPRTDSLGKITGAARYAADLFLPRTLYAKILRSPYAHARILNIDTSRAEKLPGVKAIVCGKEIIPYKWGIFKQTRDQYLLAVDKVRYIGEEVAAVASIDEEIAEEALSLINVDYEQLPSVFDPLEAIEEGSPQLHEHVERNIGFTASVEFGDVDAAFRNSDRVYEDKIVTSKISHLQMEPYAVLAKYNQTGKLDVWVPNQSPFTKRRALSNALGIPLPKIRVHHINIGGGFGGRSDTNPAEFIVSLLSIKAKRPVKITYTREETMIATRHKHPATVEIKLAVNLDGTITGKDVKIVMDGGAYMSSGIVAANTPYVYAESIYRVPNQRYEAIRVYTNKTTCSMHRTHGSQYVLAEETMIERIAEDLGLDSVEMRMRHACRAGDVLPSGSKITSYALHETIEKAVEISGWREKKGKLPEGHGIGIACAGSFAGFNLGFRLNSSALIKFNEDGSCTLFTGNVDNGQGNESMMVQIASDVLDIPMDSIALVCADSELTPQDPGNYPMLAAFCSGNAVRLAAADAKRQILGIAAEKIGLPSSDLDIRDGVVFAGESPEKSFPLSGVIKRAFSKGAAILGRGSYTPKAQSEYGWANWPGGKIQGQHGATYTDGTTVAEVRVDKETGMVKVLSIVQAYDCGFALNPMAVEGQWEGVAVEMMGETLYGKLTWDKNGRVINNSLLDYLIPTALDMPEIRTAIVESIDPEGPFGAKEAGISGGPGVQAAIANAIYNAIGVRIKEIPVTPESILACLKGGA
ncbi:MAG: molybdopterin-dependent oxidoreductase [Deltaproteobacteria bacterium]|nr:molybdopterin-dependent oxidoreductase [Deltaproteobacteria bacterium]